jgi:germination protein M
VFFYNPANNLIESERRFVPPDENRAGIGSVLNLMTDAPKSKNLSKVLPDSIDFTQLWIKGRLMDTVLEAEFTSEYSKMTDMEELFFRTAFVWSMTGLGYITQVHFFVNGQELLNSSGAPVGLMSRENVVIDPEIPPEKMQAQQVKLYFADQTQLLAAEERYIWVNPDQPVERYIVEQLISGPDREGSSPTVPPETKIRSVRTDKGTCYVNLSPEFISRHNGGAVLERLTVYSIVNSLTELPGVTKVQFLIESERVSDFKGTIDLSKLFERDETVIMGEAIVQE